MNKKTSPLASDKVRELIDRKQDLESQLIQVERALASQKITLNAYVGKNFKSKPWDEETVYMRVLEVEGKKLKLCIINIPDNSNNSLTDRRFPSAHFELYELPDFLSEYEDDLEEISSYDFEHAHKTVLELLRI